MPDLYGLPRILTNEIFSVKAFTKLLYTRDIETHYRPKRKSCQTHKEVCTKYVYVYVCIYIILYV